MDLWVIGTSVGGGLLIGLAATGLLLFNGRLAGISSIAAGLVSQQSQEWSWRLAFILGLVTGGVLLLYLRPQAFGPLAAGSPVVLAIAGLLVGFGAQVSNGCTSGHGVCGLARRSLRSLAATLTFMAAGMATVYAVKHIKEVADVLG